MKETERRLTVGSLFAGIGGFDLGFERAGFEIRWQVEIDPFCRAVLAKHWPAVKRYDDVRMVGSELERVDVICGGFPCQDISVAGRGAGIDGERSGLWFHFDRLIGDLRPRYVVVENVAALLARGMGRVLGDLAARGLDAEWDCLPASAFGAPHQRDRVWLVAYPAGGRRQWRRAGCAEATTRRAQRLSPRSGQDLADADDQRQLQPQGCEPNEWRRPRDGRQEVAHAEYGRCEGRHAPRIWTGAVVPHGRWELEPNVGRVAHGVPNRVDRLRGLGNAIVPQIAEWIAQRITEAEAESAGGAMTPEGPR